MDNKPIYKTAAELGIEQWEHDGLVELAKALGAGHLRFHMGHYCGSVCCIGGHLAARRGLNQGVYMGGSRWPFITGARTAKPETGTFSWGLKSLFYPTRIQRGGRSYSNVTDGHAARAIVNFLVTGDPQWEAVMATP